MQILFLGGTSFVGRHIAQAAIAAGHDITFCNRGITDPSLFSEQTHVRIDRSADVRALSDIAADVVIDTSGYTPDAVRASAIAVASRVRRYVFMSSIDAYDLSAPVIDETSATKTLAANATTSDRVAELYGAQKARCERDLVEILGPDRVLVVRAGLMVGPYDHTDRFTYWPVRVARGGDTLVPVGRAMPVQFIDVRDVADWLLGAIAQALSGTYNLVGTPQALTFGDVIDVCMDVAHSAVHLCWASSAWLLAYDVGQWVEMPLWLADAPEFAGLLAVRNDRALATGLRLRSLTATVRDILAEYQSRPADRVLRAGLRPDRERLLLEALRASSPPA